MSEEKDAIVNMPQVGSDVLVSAAELEKVSKELMLTKEALRLAKQDVTHLQGVVNSAWNERAAMFRRNEILAPPREGTLEFELLMAEKRMISAVFKVAPLVEFNIAMLNTPDAAAEFHLALKNLYERKTHSVVSLLEKDVANDEQESYEDLLKHGGLREPKSL